MREVGLVVNVEANNAYVQIDRKQLAKAVKRVAWVLVMKNQL